MEILSPFPVNAPESQGVSSEAIQQVIGQIRQENGLDLHSFLCLRHGQLIWEEYFHTGEKENLHVLHSVSKSFTSTAIGLAVDEGLLSLNDKLYDFFPEYAYLCNSDFKKKVTIKDLLVMGSGFENREREMMYCLLEGGLTAAALAMPVIHEPGSKFDYYTIGTFLLSAAFSKVCPEGVHHYLRRKLFDPMGFGPTQWNVDNDGIPLGGTGLFMRAYDMARLGQFYLQEGQWQGNQLLSKAYAKAAGEKQIENVHDGGLNWIGGYGYQFWRNAFGGFRADGMKGQFIIIIPEKDMVVVMTSNLENMEIPLVALEKTLLSKVV